MLGFTGRASEREGGREGLSAREREGHREGVGYRSRREGGREGGWEGVG